MRFINRHKIANQLGCAALMLALGGCAQMQGMGSYLVERVSGQAIAADNAAAMAQAVKKPHRQPARTTDRKAGK